MSGESLFIQALIILFLIVINGFFSMSEIAIISSRRSIIDKLAKDGSEAAKIVGADEERARALPRDHSGRG